MATSKINKRTVTELDVWFAECSARAKLFATAQELWLSVWNETDRINLGGDLEEAFKDLGGTVGMWEHCRASGDPNLAILQINQILDSYPENRINKMIEALGYSNDIAYSQKPNWEDITGKLHFEGKCVRTVKKHRSETKIQKVLRQFQKEGWPIGIKVKLFLDQTQTGDTVKSLNNGLAEIKFQAQSGGTEICWKKR